MENVNYQIAGKVMTEKDKGKCGDYIQYKIINEQYVILVLSDGVGSRPCDWLASKTTCEKFIEEFEITINKNDYFKPEYFIDICKSVDKEVSNPPENCKGMMSTCAAVIWNTKEKRIHYLNIGDSRIYFINKTGSIIQLSQDDVKSVNMRDKSGKTITSNGFTFIGEGLTNAFGCSNAKVSPKNCDFFSGDAVVLATDGFYNCCPTFENDILKIINSFNMNEAIEKIFKSYRDYQKDDASVLIMRNCSKNEYNFNADIDYSSLINQYTKFQLIPILFSMLEKSITSKNIKQSKEIILLMQSKQIFPSKEMLEKLIKLQISINWQEREIYDGLVTLMKKTLQ